MEEEKSVTIDVPCTVVNPKSEMADEEEDEVKEKDTIKK